MNTARGPLPSVIVTDGLWRKSLSAVRSLGKAGYEVSVLGESFFTTAFWSHFAARRIVAPVASHSPARFGEALLEEARRSVGRTGRKPILLAMEDASIAWVSENRDLVGEVASFLIPDKDALEIAMDKSATLAVAEKLGIACPRTWLPASAEEMAGVLARQQEVVCKPRHGCGSAGVRYFSGGGSGDRGLREECEKYFTVFGSPVLQERIPAGGKGLGVSFLFGRSGDCLAFCAHERLREYPVSGGPSTDRRTIQNDSLVAESLRLLQHLGWRGVAMVEWKLDPRDGVPKLMEINPRFWGSLELAIRAGVNFPTLYAEACLENRPLPAAPARVGVRCRWMIPGEILRFLSEPARTRGTLREFLRGLPGIAEEWDPADLRGTLGTVMCTGALALNPRYWKYVRR